MEQKIVFECTVILNPKAFSTTTDILVFTSVNLYVKNKPEIKIEYKDIISIVKSWFSPRITIGYLDNNEKKQLVVSGVIDKVENFSKSKLIYDFLLTAKGRDALDVSPDNFASEAKKLESKHNVFSWKMSEEELKEQVDNYKTLKIAKSYRGVSVIIMLILLLITALLGFLVNYYSLADMLINLIIFLPILFFVYKGHRWSIILLMILWTIIKGYQIIQFGNAMPFFMWMIIIPYFYKALRVENERKKLKPVATIN